LFLRGLGIRHHFGHYALQSLDAAIISGALKAEAAKYEFDLSEGLLRCKGKTQFSSAPRARNASFLLDSYKEDQYFLKVQAPGEYACGDFRFIVARRGQGGDVISEHDGIELSLAFPFIVRNRKEGDRLHTEEGIKKIDALLKEAEVPVSARHSVPVFEDRHGIAAVFLPAGVGGRRAGVLYRKPSLCEDGEIVYIFILNERRSYPQCLIRMITGMTIGESCLRRREGTRRRSQSFFADSIIQCLSFV